MSNFTEMPVERPIELPIELQPAAMELLRTAERLYAEIGVDAVSVRQIAREAGQKNHSAVQYHFGSASGLLETILDYRMVPLNRRRQLLLEAWESRGDDQDIAGLIAAMVRPLTAELLRPMENSYYLSLLLQLSNKGQLQGVVRAGSPRSTSLWRAHSHLNRLLDHLGEAVALERQSMMGRLLLTTLADWDRLRRESPAPLSPARLAEQEQVLIAFIVGGLTAPLPTP